jgi:hypothetical protein
VCLSSRIFMALDNAIIADGSAQLPERIAPAEAGVVTSVHSSFDYRAGLLTRPINSSTRSTAILENSHINEFAFWRRK